MESYETVIVGAGPAGLRCAETLAEAGKEVLVLEKDKVFGDKVCAGGLTLNDLELGIPNKIIQKKFRKILFHTPHQDTEIELDIPFIATVDRKDLGRWMADKAEKAGADIRLNSEVKKINSSTIISDNKKIRYTYLVGADGPHSIVRDYLNLKTNDAIGAFQYITPKKFKKLEVFIDQDRFGIGYVWIFPYKNSASIGTGVDLTRKVHQPVFDLKVSDVRNNFDDWCKKRFDLKKARFQACTINYDYRGHDFGKRFLVGDAGGFASGFTGEGIYFAIKSGEDIAKKIIDKSYDYSNIKHILRIKRFEETITRSMEKSKFFAKMEWEFFNLLFKIKWVEKKIVNLVD